jgi:hypothetical protein
MGRRGAICGPSGGRARFWGAIVLVCVACNSATSGVFPAGTMAPSCRCAMTESVLRLRGAASATQDAGNAALVEQRDRTGAALSTGPAASRVSSPPSLPEAPAVLSPSPGRASSHPLLLVLSLWDYALSRLPPSRHIPSAQKREGNDELESILRIDPGAELEQARKLSTRLDAVFQNADWGHVLSRSTLGTMDGSDLEVQRQLRELLSAAQDPAVESVDGKLAA